MAGRPGGSRFAAELLGNQTEAELAAAELEAARDAQEAAAAEAAAEAAALPMHERLLDSCTPAEVAGSAVQVDRGLLLPSSPAWLWAVLSVNADAVPAAPLMLCRCQLALQSAGVDQTGSLLHVSSWQVQRFEPIPLNTNSHCSAGGSSPRDVPAGLGRGCWSDK